MTQNPTMLGSGGMPNQWAKLRPTNAGSMRRIPNTILMAKGGVKEGADSVPLALAKGLELALNDVIGKLYQILKAQERISSKKFEDIDPFFVELMKKYDTDKSGALQLEEFTALVADKSQSQGQAQAAEQLDKGVEETFRTFADSTGSIDTRSIPKALADLGLDVDRIVLLNDNGITTLKGSDTAYWTPFTGKERPDQISLKPWGAPLEALFQDGFGAVKTMALFSAIKLADGGFGQFESIVAGTWDGMPPNIKGFIPRLLKIVAALKLLEQHYAAMAAWEDDDHQEFLKDAYSDEQKKVGVLRFRLAQLMFLLVRREGCVPLKGKEKTYLESVLPQMGVEMQPDMTYAKLAKQMDECQLEDTRKYEIQMGTSECMSTIADQLDEGAKDFVAYFRLRNANKRDLTAFEQSCYGQAVERQMASTLKNPKGKNELVLAELQALQALPV